MAIGYKIYTYANPFKLTEAHFWEEIKDCPHFCSSQTLVEGLKKIYGRDLVPFIVTVEGVLKGIYPRWHQDVELQINQYVLLGNAIDDLNVEDNLKKALRFNKYDLLQSIRFLQEMGIAPEDLEADKLVTEQRCLVELYQQLLLEYEEYFALDEKLELPELRYLLWGFLETEIDDQEKRIAKSKKTILAMEDSGNLGISYTKEKRRLDKQLKLCEWMEELQEKWTQPLSDVNEDIKKIVIHGIHRFTPMIVRLIQDLNAQGVEIIFLHNYESNFPKLYETWNAVYSWTGVASQPDRVTPHYLPSDFQLQQIPLGQTIGNFLEGKFEFYDFSKLEFYEFDNNTSLANYVATAFEPTITVKDGRDHYSVGQMKEQFYASNNKAVNEILKVYFPEQFGDRHFLAYPIGQFIMSLYNMWDDTTQGLRIQHNLLKECFNTNLLLTDAGKLNQIYQKLQLFFQDCQSIIEYTDRIQKLLLNLEDIQVRDELKDLTGFSFYSCSKEEVELFAANISLLNSLACELFASVGNNKLDFKRHFEKLIQKLKEQIQKKTELDQKEKELLENLMLRFDNLDNLQITGSMADLKESIHYYLKQRETEQSARWIVRNFEQIDGDVLLSRDQKDKTYHFAGLSEKYMQVKVNDQLSWPLNDQFFSEGYNNENIYCNIVFTSLKEYKNFLRYALFYGIYYVKQPIRLSFVKHEQQDKDEQPYFLLNLLGIQSAKYDEEKEDPYQMVMNPEQEATLDPIEICQPDKTDCQTYVFCPYRYVLDRFLEQGSAYESEYHADLYFKILLYERVWKNLSGQSVDEQQLLDNIRNNELELKQYFPFWKPEVDFVDKRNKVKQWMEANIHQGEVKNCADRDRTYLEIKKHFIYAKIGEGQNELGDLHDLRPDNQFTQYRRKAKAGMEKLINSTEPVSYHNGERCGVCKEREICLESYKRGVGYE